MRARAYAHVKRHFVRPQRLGPHGGAAVFLDRDGVINEDVHYLRRVADLKLIPGVGAVIAALNGAHIPVIVITNQSAVARGYLSEEGLRDLHAALAALLDAAGARIDGFYYSPFHPDGQGAYGRPSTCRKPGPDMLLAACEDFSLTLRACVMIGDKRSDLAAGRAAGCGAVALVETGYGATEKHRLRAGDADVVAPDLATALTQLRARGFLQEGMG